MNTTANVILQPYLSLHLNTADASNEVAGDAFMYRGMLPLHFAVAVKHPILPNIRAIINALPEAVELPDHRGWLPLHWCAYNSRSSETLRLLVMKYQDACFIANKKGKLPFQLSAYNRFTDITEILYRENPEAVEGMDYNGNTPLHDAGESTRPQLMNACLVYLISLIVVWCGVV